MAARFNCCVDKKDLVATLDLESSFDERRQLGAQYQLK